MRAPKFVRSSLVRRLWGCVLSIAKLGAGQEAYYLDAVARGVEDYYLGAGEAPGRWVGSATSEFNLAGTVAADDLHAVLSGVDPQTGRHVAAANRKVPGFDATFSAPKSVSLLHALGSARVRGEVAAAHDAAVGAAVGYLERQAAFTRTGRDGIHRVAASGFVGAAFRHRTSRAGDPQLHTHVLIANLARGADRRWRTLDARGLFLHKMDAGAVYQAQLRAELTHRLGVEWNQPVNGLAEINGMPRNVLGAFSRRRAEIVAALAARDQTSARAAGVAALSTRTAKTDVDPVALQHEWVERAAALDFGPDKIDALTRRGREPQRWWVPRKQLDATLTEHASMFDRRNVVRALCDAARDGADVADLDAGADRYLTSTGVVALTPDPVIGIRYSTEQMMQTESYALAAVEQQRGAGVAVVDQRVVEAELRARPSVSPEQAAMVRALTTSGAGVDVVVGAAGTGKTFALDAARAAWQASGHRVIGAALAARAAHQLESGAGIPSFTIASLQRFLTNDRLAANTVLVIDEAGMVGTRALAELIRHARRAQTKVVLVGDHRQLPEIQAGGLFAKLAHEPAAIHLVENHRQHDKHERGALAALRSGRVGDAIARLTRRGRITTADNSDLLRQRLVADWYQAVDNGQVALMLARRRVDVADLNTRARHALLDNGYLDPNTQVTVGGLTVCEGDWVVATRNRPSLGVINGDLGIVIQASDNTLTLQLDRSPTVILPAEYVASHVQHGYALTIHKAQGATCDAAFVLGDDTLALESGYTALSRGRNRNQLYVMNSDEPDNEEHHGRVANGDVDLVARLRRSEAKELAIDHAIGVEL